MFENMGFEHLPDGYVLLNPGGGGAFGQCVLLSPVLVEGIEAVLDGDEEAVHRWPITVVRELTQDAPEDTTDEARRARLEDFGLFNGDAESVYVFISNLWYRGHALTVATKPLPLPQFIQAVQAHDNQIRELDLATHWIG